MLLWKLGQQILLVNDVRAKRHIANDSGCSLCGAPIEHYFHTFRDCTHVRKAWNQLLTPTTQSFFSCHSFQEWLYSNFICISLAGSIRWSLLFGVTLDQIWKMRNEAIFQRIPVSTSSLTIASRRMAEGIIASKQVREKAMQRGTSARE